MVDEEHYHLEDAEGISYTETGLFCKVRFVSSPSMENKMATKTIKGKSVSRQGTPNCRVLDLGISKFAECLKEGPSTCSYAVPFGYCFLCKHPHVDRMIENTKKNQMVLEA